MQISLTLIRILFLGLCTLLATILANAAPSSEDPSTKLVIGALSGAVFGGLLIGLEIIFKSFNLRTFNTAAIGLFVGYLMGSVLLMVIKAILDMGSIHLDSQTLTALQASVFLAVCYFGMVLTARASNELHLSIPFIQFKTNNKSKKDIILDASALADPRTIDLAVSGLLDQSLVIPRFLLKDLHELAESTDEATRQRAKRCLEAHRKLEAIPSLEICYAENNFAELHDIGTKLSRLARQLDASILTADPSRIQNSNDTVRYINLNSISNLMKPLAHNGESLNIKIQRYGKEPRQGVGYLEDGTMVVVNGGADYIGATIRAQVLSVKHTTSGRMIFCNAADSDFCNEPALAGALSENENHPSNYFAV